MSGFFTAPRVAWGPGAVEQLSGLGIRSALVLIDPTIAALDPARRVVQELARSETPAVVVDDIPATATLRTLARLIDRSQSASFDTVLGVGGGSLIDLAKALVATRARPDLDVRALTPLAEIAGPARPRLIAIPTTGGSGSEATGSSNLLAEDGSTIELVHRDLTPDWALVDPIFGRSMPPALAIDTGMEVVAHALEAIASEWANPFSDALARDAAVAALTALPRLARHPRDEEARTSLFYAATRAGLAASNAQLGLAHALARALLPDTGLGYGRLLGIVLPYVVDFNFGSARDRYLSLGPVLSEPVGQNHATLSERLHALGEQLQIPRSLAAAGVPLDALRAQRTAIVQRALHSTTCIANPRVPSPEELRRLVELVTGSDGAHLP
ncbi:MAG: iron-containing alcohol dehydrogenase [Thermoplasmata archaeon]